MEVKKIYFDMDGVLADFDRGTIELCHLPVYKQGESPDNDEELYAGMRAVGHFYDKLEPTSGAEELFHAVFEKYGEKCEILSGIPKPHRGITTAGEDKIKWMRRLFSEDVVLNIVFSEQKQEYCTGPDCILIDDYDRNIRQWEAKGGTGILHTSCEDTVRQLKELRIL